MLSPHAEKWGDASPRPPAIDARASNTVFIRIHISAGVCAGDWRS